MGNHQKIATLEIADRTPVDLLKTRFSPDSRWLVTWPESLLGPRDQQVLEVWDAATGQRLGHHVLRRPVGRTAVAFAPDFTCLALAEWSDVLDKQDQKNIADHERPGTVTFLDLPFGKVRWDRPFALEQGAIIRPSSTIQPRFSPDGTMLAVYTVPNGEWTFLDPRTGQSLATVPVFDGPAQRRYNDRDEASADGRRYLAQAQILRDARIPLEDWLPRWALPLNRTTLSVVVDGTNGQQQLRLSTADQAYSNLAPDGRLLLTDTPDPDRSGGPSVLQAWPVPLGRPWGWIIGFPLAMAVVLGGAAGMLRWRRKTRRVEPHLEQANEVDNRMP